MSAAWSADLHRLVDDVLPEAMEDLSSASADRYRAVPSVAHARYLVPLGSRAAGRSAVRGYGRLRSLRQQAGRDLAQIVVGATTPASGDVLRVPRTGTDLASHLASVLGLELQLGLPVRTRNPHSKPTLQLLTQDGATHAFCKVARTPGARTRLHAEREGLLRLARTPTTRLRVPTVLHSGTWRGRELLVTAPLPPDARLCTPRSFPSTFPLLFELLDTARVDALADSPWWQDLAQRIDALTGAGAVVRESVARAHAVLGDSSGATALMTGPVHGDWVPWNLAVRGQEVWCWDLEHSRACAPFGHDVVLGMLLVQTHLRGMRLHQAHAAVWPRALQSLGELGLSRASAMLAVRTSLLELVVRSAEVADDELGWQPGLTPDLLLKVLDDQTYPRPSRPVRREASGRRS
jgi:hypothetical protein